MAEIRPELSTGTLLVFDIDNTLIEPVGNIGSDQWYYYIEKAYKRDGLDQAAAEAKAGEAWSRTLATVKVKPVEDLIPALVREQQKRGLKILALTAREPADAPATFKQLNDAGIDLAGNVEFVGDGPDKGKALVAYLKKNKLKPSKIVFVDDKPHHAKNVDAALTAAGIPSVSFRYGAADAKVRAFNEVMDEAGDKANADLLFNGRLSK
jgi:FMN phosphatase YigB (HAD superfamily)